MRKHAYLIMAHSDFGLLRKLIVLLDDARNDIYVHVDKKAREFNPQSISGITTMSDLIFVERKSTSWEHIAWLIVSCLY